MTLEEVAKELECSTVTVWQIQSNALKKIRKALQQHNITYEELLLCLKYS